ncbi:MAG TPA: hypothetical protein VFQ91_24495 [Bryobacteraceae bacterium]|nr:hypothetical protein [Bryobacteraceae bacterium]
MHTLFRLVLAVAITAALVSSFAANRPASPAGALFVEGPAIGENWEAPL